MRNLTRRAALMGAAGLLSACDTISDSFDSMFGERKTPLPGERRPVLSSERPVEADEGPRIPVTLPPEENRADWPQAGGGLAEQV